MHGLILFLSVFGLSLFVCVLALCQYLRSSCGLGQSLSVCLVYVWICGSTCLDVGLLGVNFLSLCWVLVFVLFWFSSCLIWPSFTLSWSGF
jgi:hypothetical protein